MANRFLETNYYKSPYVRGLKGTLKGLYSFIICDCTGSGIWALDLQAASMYIGFNVTSDEFDEFFIKKGKAVNLGNGKFFFPDFIEHQYPSGLSEKNPAHKNIISELRRLNLIDANNCVFSKKNNKNNKIDLEGTQKGLGRDLEGTIYSPNGNNNSNGYGNGNGNKGENSDFVCYDVEEYILGNQVLFERICTVTSKIADEVKTELHLYHLWLEKNEKYPFGKKPAAAGFESWLLNGKKFNNKANGTTHQQTITANKFTAGQDKLLAKGQRIYADITGKQNN